MFLTLSLLDSWKQIFVNNISYPQKPLGENFALCCQCLDGGHPSMPMYLYSILASNIGNQK
jgi:hypothetical protein